jgi:PAS domain S-box-containing protein
VHDSDAISILDSALDALVVTDAKGSIVWLNRAAERTFGYSRSAAVGREAAELVVPEDLREADREGIARVAEGGPEHILGRRVEFPALRSDGSEFPAEMTVTRAGDSPLRFTAWIRELVPSEREDQADQRLRTLIEGAEQAAGLGSWDWDIETGELLWSENLFRLFGLEPGALQPTPEYVFERTHPDDRARVEREVSALSTTGQMTPLEYRIIRADGALAYLTATLAVADALNGRPTRLIGSVQDITARRRAEREVTAHVAVAVALSEWRSFDESAVSLLRGLTESLDFAAAALWVPEDGRLTPRVSWGEAPDQPGLALLGWHGRTPVHQRGAIAIPVMTGQEVLAVIELYSRGEVSVTERLMETLTGIGYEVGQFLAHRRSELSPPALTERELQVLQLAARGNPGPRIAAELFLSPATVKTHFENIYAKLGVSDRAAAVAYALRLGMIE